MSDDEDEVVTDGRVARRQRNQDTVLDAVIALFDAGQSEPAVEDVSELSGVSTRSIYRYFHHREGLIDAAVWHLVERVGTDEPLQMDDAPLPIRVRGFVDHRLSVFLRIAPLVRASKRLARTLPAAAEDDAPTPGGRPTLFTEKPSVAFAADFERIDVPSRPIAELAADVMFEFDSIECLARAVESETSTMSAVLERHLLQQLAAA